MDVNRRDAEAGFAVAWVVAILMIVGIVVTAMLQLAPISLRAALREEQAVQALAHAESGLAYALAWFESDEFDFNQFGPGAPRERPLLSEPRELGDGGISELVVVHRGNAEYEIYSSGYQNRPDGSQAIRTVQAAVQLKSSRSGAVFTWYQLALPPGYQDDPDHPTNDPESPVYQYQVIETAVEPMPPWQMPDYGPGLCENVNTSSRDVENEACRWGGSYRVEWASSPATMEHARVRIEGNMGIGGSWTFSAKNSVIAVNGKVDLGGSSRSDFDATTLYVDGDATFGGSSASTFKGPTKIYTGGHLTIGGSGGAEFSGDTEFYVGRNLTIGGSGKFKFHGDTTVYVDGDLVIQGSGKMEFTGSAVFHVKGNVYINGSGWTAGTSGPDEPWIVFHVGKGLEITGAAGAGASIPDAAFLLDTSPDNAHYPVVMTGSSTLHGGVYAPTRTFTIQSSSDVWGSIIAQEINIPHYRSDEQFRHRYLANEERMKSFMFSDVTVTRGVERLLEWRESSRR